MLTKMLFATAEPHLRYVVLQRFYRLNCGLIERFYAGKSTLADRLRVLTGKPPVPVAGGQQVQLIAGIMRARETLPMLSGLGFLLSPLVVGLLAGASVSAWRSLSEDARVDITA